MVPIPFHEARIKRLGAQSEVGIESLLWGNGERTSWGSGMEGDCVCGGKVALGRKYKELGSVGKQKRDLWLGTGVREIFLNLEKSDTKARKVSPSVLDLNLGGPGLESHLKPMLTPSPVSTSAK